MDTDDLSIETYKAILETAELFSHELTIEFGVLAMDCRDDNAFLDQSEMLINKCRKNIKGAMKHIFCDDNPSQKEFEEIIEKISSNIKAVKAIPIENREFEQW